MAPYISSCSESRESETAEASKARPITFGAVAARNPLPKLVMVSQSYKYLAQLVVLSSNLRCFIFTTCEKLRRRVFFARSMGFSMLIST
jgi:hypothetical protein